MEGTPTVRTLSRLAQIEGLLADVLALVAEVHNDIDSSSIGDLSNAVSTAKVRARRLGLEVSARMLADDAQTSADGRPKCPGCSMPGVPTKHNCHVFECIGCTGLFTRSQIPIEHAKYFVMIDQPMLVSSRDQRYFDFVVIEGDDSIHRRHGWFDPITKRVVQWG